MTKLVDYLRQLADRDGSDLFFSVGAPVYVKVEGRLQILDEAPVSEERMRALLHSFLNERQLTRFARRPELDMGLSLEGVGRFRINVYRQRGQPALVARYLKQDIPSLTQLNLPPRLADLVMLPRGLLLIVGATGTGKSTTLASMIDHRNRHSVGHILTVEDPIEYVHRHRSSIVDQREVGLDTLSYSDALKHAMREAPDVILIGEIRDRETMQHAISYAETGHLCLSTLHANNAYQAFERIMTFFPEVYHRQLLMDLSMNLRAVVSQRLVPGVDGRRLPAVEMLMNTPHIGDLILRGEIDQLREAMARTRESGSCTFDDSLYNLYAEGRISHEEALRHAESVNDLRLRIRLEEGVEEGSAQAYGILDEDIRKR